MLVEAYVLSSATLPLKRMLLLLYLAASFTQPPRDKYAPHTTYEYDPLYMYIVHLMHVNRPEEFFHKADWLLISIFHGFVIIGVKFI